MFWDNVVTMDNGLSVNNGSNSVGTAMMSGAFLGSASGSTYVPTIESINPPLPRGAVILSDEIIERPSMHPNENGANGRCISFNNDPGLMDPGRVAQKMGKRNGRRRRRRRQEHWKFKEQSNDSFNFEQSILRGMGFPPHSFQSDHYVMDQSKATSGSFAGMDNSLTMHDIVDTNFESLEFNPWPQAGGTNDAAGDIQMINRTSTFENANEHLAMNDPSFPNPQFVDQGNWSNQFERQHHMSKGVMPRHQKRRSDRSHISRRSDELYSSDLHRAVSDEGMLSGQSAKPWSDYAEKQNPRSRSLAAAHNKHPSPKSNHRQRSSSDNLLISRRRDILPVQLRDHGLRDRTRPVSRRKAIKITDNLLCVPGIERVIEKRFYVKKREKNTGKSAQKDAQLQSNTSDDDDTLVPSANDRDHVAMRNLLNEVRRIKSDIQVLHQKHDELLDETRNLKPNVSVPLDKSTGNAMVQTDLDTDTSKQNFHPDYPSTRFSSSESSDETIKRLKHIHLPDLSGTDHPPFTSVGQIDHAKATFNKDRQYLANRQHNLKSVMIGAAGNETESVQSSAIYSSASELGMLPMNQQVGGSIKSPRVSVDAPTNVVTKPEAAHFEVSRQQRMHGGMIDDNIQYENLGSQHEPLHKNVFKVQAPVAYNKPSEGYGRETIRRSFAGPELPPPPASRRQPPLPQHDRSTPVHAVGPAMQRLVGHEGVASQRSHTAAAMLVQHNSRPAHARNIQVLPAQTIEYSSTWPTGMYAAGEGYLPPTANYEQSAPPMSTRNRPAPMYATLSGSEPAPKIPTRTNAVPAHLRSLNPNMGTVAPRQNAPAPHSYSEIFKEAYGVDVDHYESALKSVPTATVSYASVDEDDATLVEQFSANQRSPAFSQQRPYSNATIENEDSENIFSMIEPSLSYRDNTFQVDETGNQSYTYHPNTATKLVNNRGSADYAVDEVRVGLHRPDSQVMFKGGRSYASQPDRMPSSLTFEDLVQQYNSYRQQSVQPNDVFNLNAMTLRSDRADHQAMTEQAQRNRRQAAYENFIC